MKTQDTKQRTHEEIRETYLKLQKEADEIQGKRMRFDAEFDKKYLQPIADYRNSCIEYFKEEE